MATDFMTSVWLCKDVPLNNTYTNVLDWTSWAEEHAYFRGKKAFEAVNQSYQREDKYVRFPANKETIDACNYLVFQNTAYSDKWFYAFITEIKYINDNCSQVYFEIDVWSTYWESITIHQCFVEREHVLPADDIAGNYLLDEGFALGDYINNKSWEYVVENWWVCVGATIDLNNIQGSDNHAGGTSYGNVYSGLRYWCYDIYGGKLNNVIRECEKYGKADAIVNMFMLPKVCLPASQMDGQQMSASWTQGWNYELSPLKTLDGYTPKNQKLLTYPYNCLVMGNRAGNYNHLRFEFFSNPDAPVFWIYGIPQPAGTMVSAPRGYNHIAINTENMITAGSFVQCIWIKDNYTNWLATQEIKRGYISERTLMQSVTSVGKDIIKVGMSYGERDIRGITSGVMGAADSIINSVSNYVLAMQQMEYEKEVYSLTPPSAVGNASSNITNMSLGNYGFVFYQKTITKEKAESIDTFFELFGYKINKVKQPDYKTRSVWNYVKTQNAFITGDCPAGAVVILQQMFNNGVTFWHQFTHVGDYSQNNH